MKTLSILILILAANIAVAAQNNFAGIYRAAIFDQNSQMVLIEMEVKPDATAMAKIALSGENNAQQIIENLAGTVDQKGKIKIEAAQSDGSTIKITGNLPKSAKADQAKAVLTRKIKTKGNGSINVSSHSIEGNWVKIEKQIEKPIATPPAKDELVDTGKTHLYFTETPILYSGEWLNAVFTSKDETIDSGKTTIRILEAIERDTANQPMRTLRIRLKTNSDTKTWTAENKTVETVTYREVKGDLRQGFFSPQTGEIEIVADTQSAVVYRIKNLRLKKIGADQFVKISGFLHVAK